ncbi:MAG TPA: dienelactone hydrolase family protein [Longimicrobium sp.]
MHIVRTREVRVPTRDAQLDATLVLPRDPAGVVLFADGSGSSRPGPPDRCVAGVLNQAGIATVLLDLLTPEEAQADARTRLLRSDVGLLARRLVDAVDWLRGAPDTRGLAIGCFGAGTGAGAALIAAAERTEAVRAVVSRGGRPDLAGEALAWVRAPTLLLVGDADTTVMRRNHDALGRMADAEAVIHVVGGATHLLEEPGAVEKVAALARAWFLAKLADRIDPAAAPAGPGADRATGPADCCDPIADPCRVAPERGVTGGEWGRGGEVDASGVNPAFAGTAPSDGVA